MSLRVIASLSGGVTVPYGETRYGQTAYLRNGTVLDILPGSQLESDIGLAGLRTPGAAEQAGEAAGIDRAGLAN